MSEFQKRTITKGTEPLAVASGTKNQLRNALNSKDSFNSRPGSRRALNPLATASGSVHRQILYAANPFLLNRLKALSLALLVMLGVASAASSEAFAQERDWQPQRTWVFIVGTLRWKHREVFNSFPQKNRRDAQLVDFFRRQGVPGNQLVYLQDAQATTRRVNSTFKDFLSRARPGDLLFFYYCGHGYKSDDQRTTYFATYDAGNGVPGWAAESVIRDVEKYFKGSRALLTADSCYSGSLAEQAQQAGRRVSYAVLTSASANELSTENWTFTEMLLAGLDGRAFADINDDRKITLGELADNIRQDMRFAEEQGSAFVASGEFSRDLKLAEARPKISPEISRRVEVKSEGAWYKARIIDVRSGRFRVHYYGWEDSDDEWVRRSQIRNVSARDERAGSGWENQWASTPTGTDPNSWLVHYIDDVWDGWTTREELCPKRQFESACSRQSAWYRTARGSERVKDSN